MIRFVSIVSVICLILCGCSPGDNDIENGLILRQRLANGCSFIANIVADFGDMTYSFSMDCTMGGDGAMSFRIISPESISDISGKISTAGGKLTFDDSVLTFPLLAEGEISPVSAPWLFYRILTGGYIRASSNEENGVRLTIDDTFSGENIQLDVWLCDEQVPEYAEILWNGRLVLRLRFDEFSIL